MNTTRWAIIGTGMAAASFAQALQGLPDARLTSVVSRSAERARSFAATFDIPCEHVSHQSLFDSGGIDAIYIASPPQQHLAHAVGAIGAGIPILVEKPFAVDQAEAATIIDAASAAGVFCMEAMWTRFNPTVRRVAELIGDGAIGRVVHIDASLGYDHIDQTGHRFESAGGGALLDLGVYPISIVSSLVTRRTEVQSLATLTNQGVDVHNLSVLTFADGATASVVSSFQCRCRNDMLIIGEEGSISVGAPMLKPTFHRVMKHPESAQSGNHQLLNRLRRRANRELAGRPRFTPIQGNGYAYQATEVADCLRAGVLESSIVPWSDTLEVMATLDAIRSSWTKP